MKRFQYRPVERLARRPFQCITALSAVVALAGAAAGCSEAKAGNNVVATQQALDLSGLAAQCGLVCPGDKDADGITVKGIAEGNAGISGVASIDAFFQSVVSFNAAANATAGGIDAQITAMKADFGLQASTNFAADLKAKFDANLDAGYRIDAQPAHCEADVQATLDATAKCDATVKPGMASVQCKGTCQVEAGAKVDCGAMATVQCSFTDPSVMCGGSCSGSCDVSAGASCDGTCNGTCSGTCSVKNADGSCGGTCSGMCMGSCKLKAGAMCMGSCKGECTAMAPTGGCMASAKASCTAMASASAKCTGKCEGDFEPPMAKAECQASAKADAKVNVQCTPPSVNVSYHLKAVASADVAAQAKFEAGLKTFASVRLPALLASIKKAGVVVDAGAGLKDAAGVAVKGAVNTYVGDTANLSLKASVGLGCAVTELPKAASSITASTTTLQASLTAATDIATMLGT